MRILYCLSIVLLALTSCKSGQPFKVSEVSHLYFEHNPAGDINYGKTVQGKFVARLTNGKEIEVTENRKFTFASVDLKRDGETNNYKIIKHPSSFDEDYATMTLTLEDKEETFRVFDTVRMTFTGDLEIDCSGQDGADGEDGPDRGKKWLGRNGKDGVDGTNGLNGMNASSYESFIWKEDSALYVYIRDMKDLTRVWKYKSFNASKVKFDISGGHGGKGGDGGDGGDGKDGKEKNDDILEPGDGGDGGNAGNGGNGGNGGAIEVHLHQDINVIEPNLNFNTLGGNGGKGGIGGKGGEGGRPLSGQSQGDNGSNGTNGIHGVHGTPGNIPQVQVETFNGNQFK